MKDLQLPIRQPRIAAITGAECAKPSDVFGWTLRKGRYKLLAEAGAMPEFFGIAAEVRAM